MSTSPAEAMTPLYDPKLCYILDGFLLLYGLLITGLLLREKVSLHTTIWVDVDTCLNGYTGTSFIRTSYCLNIFG
uniref:Uncharacterized protein n=1 Tax=Hucho hucho TaxID=62062 RepID=A0A4W5KKC5_9TELE